jgi:hypothetical protein
MKHLSLLLIGIAAPAYAGILGVTGDFSVFAPATASYVANAYDDPTEAPMRIWTEQIAIELASSVDLDTDLADSTKKYVVGGAGAGEVAFGAGSGPTLAKGTRVNVYYAYFDPVSDSARGTVTFEEKILGIVAHTGQLQFSDFLRVAGAPYPMNPAFAARGWENSEWGMVDAARTTFTWNAAASSPGDQFRIFTEATDAAVPEPGSFALLAAGIGALALARRKR